MVAAVRFSNDNSSSWEVAGSSPAAAVSFKQNLYWAELTNTNYNLHQIKKKYIENGFSQVQQFLRLVTQKADPVKMLSSLFLLL